MSNFFEVLVVAISLSMDTFSLSMAYGMLGISNKEIIKISTFVAIFHFIMPIVGNIFGEFITNFIEINPSIIIGIIFLSLAIQLIISLFKEEKISSISNFFSLLLFSFTVSIDSFTVGIGLRVISNSILLPLVTFMSISYFFTYIGLTFGKKIIKIIGKKAEVLGIILLIALAINYITKGC